MRAVAWAFLCFAMIDERLKVLLQVGATQGEAETELGRALTDEEKEAFRRRGVRDKVARAKRKLDKARRLAEAPERLTKAQLAARWGVTRSAVTQMFARPGAPAFDNGTIDAAVAESWRDTNKRGPASGEVTDADVTGLPEIAESRRKAEAYKAKILELEFRKADGSLIPLADAIDRAKSDAAVIKSTLLSMPARLAPTLADAAGNVAAVSAILDAWARESLTSFARLMGAEA